MNCSRMIALRVTSICLTCIALLTAMAYGAPTLQLISPNGSTKLTLAKSSSDVVFISVTQTAVGDAFLYKDALFWGGDVDELPKFVLTSLKIQERNKPVFIPLSVYSDLGDVTSASVNATGDGFLLNLHGGGTATGYDATLVFSRGYVVSKTVRLREFPEERVEKTTYAFPKGSR